jgi:hypothetical protein
MSGNSYCLDTNILIYLLDGDKALASLLQGANFYISFITELELLSYPDLRPEEKREIQQLLNECTIIEINSAIKNIVIKIRSQYRVKLPDTMVNATAEYLNLSLLTADNGMDRMSELNVLLYKR